MTTKGQEFAVVRRGPGGAGGCSGVLPDLGAEDVCNALKYGMISIKS